LKTTHQAVILSKNQDASQEVALTKPFSLSIWVAYSSSFLSFPSPCILYDEKWWCLLYPLTSHSSSLGKGSLCAARGVGMSPPTAGYLNWVDTYSHSTGFFSVWLLDLLL